jgi:ATP-binding cassette subfamily F protein 3
MLQLQQITKGFGPQTVLEDVTLQIVPQTRLGLIGRNGCGKTTLLRILTSQTEPDGGIISRTPGWVIQYLSQEPHITPGLTLEEEMRTVFQSINRLQEEETHLLQRLEQEGHENHDMVDPLLKRLDDIHQALHRLDAGSMEARISRTLRGLGFQLSDYSRKVETFSGGWQMRINLAKLLLEPADLLLLDEPTNHLDLAACEWLEQYLREYPGAVVVVSHDRRFLDQVVTEIAELELGRLTVWPGNYTEFLDIKAEFLAQQAEAYARQQKEIEKQSAFIERFRASATRSTQAKSREKQLARQERIQLTATDQRQVAIRLDPTVASGRQVLTLRNVSKAFGEKKLFAGLTADVQRHQRIFLLGANGCGKTTLFRLMLGLETPDTGEIRPGHQVVTGYFSQKQLETLTPTDTVFDSLHAVCPQFTQTQVRTLLAQFLLAGDQVFKPVSVLSGGEKSKLALARLMVEGPNTLLLDEPTNHMDIPAKEALESALLSYTGTILCISHDRYFIQKLATNIWEFHEGQLICYDGDYDYYLSKRDEMRALAAERSPQRPQPVAVAPAAQPVQASQPSPNGGKSPLQAKRDLEKQLTQLEKRIIRHEAALAELSAKMHDPAIQQDFQRLADLTHEMAPIQSALAADNAQWEALAEQLTALS